MTTPAWPRRLRRTGFWALAVLLVLALLVGLLAVWSVRRPQPTHAGELTLPGLAAPVTVHRDEYGIPHIYAETETDLFMAQGFVHAQDRFWEMDFRRHVTSGRLSELFGDGQVETDAFLRTLGWRRVAEAEWDLLGPQSRDYLTAYADGVNAWVEETGGPAATGRKSLHYRVLGLQNPGYEIAPWHPVDSLAWLKAMAWDLRGNLEAETERAALFASGRSRAEVSALFPSFRYDRQRPIVSGGRVADGVFDPAAGTDGGPPPLTGSAGGGGEFGAGSGGQLGGGTGGLADRELTTAASLLAAVGRAADRVPALLGTGSGLGSNSWVVSGEHTDTGAPILVNDPHLSPSMPGIWYQLGLHCACGYQVSGFSFSGVPGVVIGHNGQIGWGFTNLGHDVTDLYLERLDGDRYEVDGELRELSVHEETIQVAGGEDVTIAVRQTHRGPLISDVDDSLAELAAGPLPTLPALPTPAGEAGDGNGGGGNGGGQAAGYGLSLAWTALRPGTTMEAVFVLNRATGWDDFQEAARLFEVPAQNLLYADVAGNIGYQAPGMVPVRGAGDGRWVAPGWDSRYDWGEPLPFEQLPYQLNPETGYLVTANQAVIGPDYQPLLTTDWAHGYRSERIHQLLTEAMSAGPIGVDDMQRLVFDNRNNLAPVLVPALLAAPTPPRSADEQAALELLRGWDFQQPAEGEPGTTQARSAAAAAYFNAVWRQLLTLTFDELPEDHPATGGGRWFTVLTGLLAEPDSEWWDRVDTGPVETRDQILAEALAAAYQQVAIAQGDDPGQWRWGQVHTLELRDATLGNSGIAPVEALFNRGPVDTAGGTDVVNATSWHAGDGYQVTVVPSMRMIVDMAELDGSRWVQLTGNSGHPYHRNYLDQLELWRTGETLPWHWDRASIEAAARDTLTLRPG